MCVCYELHRHAVNMGILDFYDLVEWNFRNRIALQLIFFVDNLLL